VSGGPEYVGVLLPHPVIERSKGTVHNSADAAFAP
jgi:hypothetical protein